MIDRQRLGKRLKQARIAKGLTQEQLAETADTSVVYISELERGIKLPSLPLLVTFTEILNISADDLLCNSVEESRGVPYADLTRKLDSLSRKQRQTIMDILDAYMRNL